MTETTVLEDSNQQKHQGAEAASKAERKEATWAQAGMFGLLMALVASLFISAFLWPMTTATPKDIDLGIAGPAEATAGIEQVLATKQHLQTGAREQLAEGPQAHPRVFVEESDTAVVSRSAPAFDRPVAGGVDVGARIDHVLKGHASGHQALMTVTQHQFGDTNFAGFGDLNLSRTHEAIVS